MFWVVLLQVASGLQDCGQLNCWSREVGEIDISTMPQFGITAKTGATLTLTLHYSSTAAIPKIGEGAIHLDFHL